LCGFAFAPTLGAHPTWQSSEKPRWVSLLFIRLTSRCPMRNPSQRASLGATMNADGSVSETPAPEATPVGSTAAPAADAGAVDATMPTLAVRPRQILLVLATSQDAM